MNRSKFISESRYKFMPLIKSNLIGCLKCSPITYCLIILSTYVFGLCFILKEYFGQLIFKKNSLLSALAINH